MDNKANDIIPFPDSKSQTKVSEWIEYAQKDFDSYIDYIEKRKQEISIAYRDIAGEEISDYFKKSEAKNPPVKFPVALDDKAKKTFFRAHHINNGSFTKNNSAIEINRKMIPKKLSLKKNENENDINKEGNQTFSINQEEKNEKVNKNIKNYRF